MTVTAAELLPAGIYPIWSPYDSFEAAAALMAALTAEALCSLEGPDEPGR